jgi:hypothetical protein
LFCLFKAFAKIQMSPLYSCGLFSKKFHHNVMNLHAYLQCMDFNTTHNPILWEHVNVVIKAMTQLSNKHLE